MSDDFALLTKLYDVMVARRGSSPCESYTAKLLSEDGSYVARKFGEEATELVVEAAQGDEAAIVRESADVLYHLLALWLRFGVSPADVMAELERRRKISGLEEKASRTDYS